MRRLLGRRRRRWAVVVSSPKGEAGEQWGDTWFAEDLVEALVRGGQDARVVRRSGAASEARDRDDVVLVLRGLRPVAPRPGRTIWMLWIISHPEDVSAEELKGYDAVFAASNHWHLDAEPLLQATNPRRFAPSAAVEGSGEPVLFVGSTRGVYRPMVRDAMAAGIPIGVWGVGWEEFLPASAIRGAFLPNDLLPQAYAGAGVVLNDHWEDMGREGFLSNRLFDAVASGAAVISDPATGLSEVFGDIVQISSSPEQLAAALASLPDRNRRLAAAARIASEHSFDARAAVLIERAERLGAR